MTPGPPPPRYRVVERGRRLEVIDTRTGQPVRRSMPVPPPLPAGDAGEALARRLSRGERLADGRFVLRTRPEFDGKGPRGIALREGGARLLALVAVAIGIVVAAVLVAFVLFGLSGIVITGLVIGMATQHGRPMLTRLLDRLGETVEVPPDRP